MATNVEKQMETTPADWVPGPGQGHWTYNHYAALPDDGHRYEVVDGVLYMSPSPNDFHQNVSIWLSHYLVVHVMVPGLGKVRAAPFDVELAPDIVVQPDLIVVLNANLAKITRSHIVGAPDLVVEVLSPGTAKHDRHAKQSAYARSGVAEYWIVDPVKATIEVLFLQDEAYQSAGVFSGQDTLVSKIVPTIAEIHVEQFFV